MSKDYEVGYGRPPKKSRFRKGQSGNPKGRPKGSVTGAAAREKALSQTVSVAVNGRKQKMTAEEALWQQETADALQGDKKSRRMLLEYSLRFPTHSTPANDNAAGAPVDDLAPEDEAILEAYRRNSLAKESGS